MVVTTIVNAIQCFHHRCCPVSALLYEARWRSAAINMITAATEVASSALMMAATVVCILPPTTTIATGVAAVAAEVEVYIARVVHQTDRVVTFLTRITATVTTVATIAAIVTTTIIAAIVAALVAHDVVHEVSAAVDGILVWSIVV